MPRYEAPADSPWEMTFVKRGDRVIFVPDAEQPTEDHERAIRMQALAELRALNEDPPEHPDLRIRP
jgi:hypothetical protein